MNFGCGVLGCGGETGDPTGAATESEGTAGESTMAMPTTGEATTAGATSEYTAFWVPAGAGMYTRLAVRRVNVADDLCTTVVFTTPFDAQEDFEVSTPALWATEYAVVQQGAEDCLAVYQIATEPVSAESGQGTVTWLLEGGCPPTVDIDVTAVFPAEQPWAPAEVVLQSGGIEVQGC